MNVVDELLECVCCKSELMFSVNGWSHVNYYLGDDKRFFGIFEKGRTYQIKPYSLCKYPVTLRLFKSLMGFNPSTFKNIRTSFFEK